MGAAVCASDIEGRIEEVEAVVLGCSALVVGDCSGMTVVIWGTDEEVIVVDIWLYTMLSVAVEVFDIIEDTDGF